MADWLTELHQWAVNNMESLQRITYLISKGTEFWGFQLVTETWPSGNLESTPEITSSRCSSYPLLFSSLPTHVRNILGTEPLSDMWWDRANGFKSAEFLAIVSSFYNKKTVNRIDQWNKRNASFFPKNNSFQLCQWLYTVLPKPPITCQDEQSQSH